MGTTTLQVVMGEGLMARVGKFRAKENYPPEKTNDSFVRYIFMKQLDKEVPE
jgi:hypothetical protein